MNKLYKRQLVLGSGAKRDCNPTGTDLGIVSMWRQNVWYV